LDEEVNIRSGCPYARLTVSQVAVMLILAAELRQTRLAPKRSEYTDASVPSFSEVESAANAAASFIPLVQTASVG
jgi:hypothetical protein